MSKEIIEGDHKAIEKQSIGVGLISNPVPMDKVVDLSFLKSTLTNPG